jgi:hypothetical protein
MAGVADKPGIFVAAGVAVSFEDGVSVKNGAGVFDGSAVFVAEIAGIAGRHELKRIIKKNKTMV